MNRQLRRAQEKSDEKAEKDKQKAKQARVEKRQRRIVKRQEQREKRKEEGSEAKPKVIKDPKRLPGRFSSILAIMTLGFIVLQAVIPVADSQNPTFALVIQVIYYLLFSYFLYLWLARSQFKQALYLTVGVGVAVTLGLIGLQLALPNVTPDFQMMPLGIAAVIIGTLLGQLVFNRGS